MPEHSRKEHLMKIENMTQSATKILNDKRKRRNPKLFVENNFEELTTISNSFISNEFSDIYDGEIDMTSNYTGFLEVIGK